MNVVDSCGWLEVLSVGPNSRHFKPILLRQVALIVPALVLYEVTKRVRAVLGQEHTEGILAILGDAIYIEVTREIVDAAVDVSIKYKLATADSLIYATALEYDAMLWTQDKHFKGLPHVKYFEKSA